MKKSKFKLILLFIGLVAITGTTLSSCNDDNDQSKNNSIVGKWIAVGVSYSNNDTIQPLSSNMEIDTITFRNDNYIEDNYTAGYNGCHYNIINDSVIKIENTVEGYVHTLKFKFVGNDIIIYNWRHRDIAEYIYNIRFKKI
ncbi:MAG: lipocalin family protein [Bacteroidales bacterium]|jgi:hypothetical protein|nr:lipocalin family protein [Bacteroidales bacterium]